MHPRTLSAFRDELEKIARSVAKDFLAGVDPTGTKTFAYGVQDAKETKGRARARAAVGTAGGLVGGGVVVPAAVSGLIGGAKGFSRGGLRGAAQGAVSGAVKPFRGLARAVRGSRALSQAATKGLKASDIKNLGNLADDVGLAGAGKLVSKHTKDGISAKAIQAGGPEAQKLLSSAVGSARNRVIAGGATLGLSGAVGAGSAALQYGKGRSFGKPLTDEQRAKMR